MKFWHTNVMNFHEKLSFPFILKNNLNLTSTPIRLVHYFGSVFKQRDLLWKEDFKLMKQNDETLESIIFQLPTEIIDYLSLFLNDNDDLTDLRLTCRFFAYGLRHQLATRIKERHSFCQIAIGENFSLILLENGTVMGLGKNDTQQLGLHKSTFVDSPAHIPNLSKIIQVAASAETSYFLNSDGLVFSCGANGSGQLCLNYPRKKAAATPTQIKNLLNITQIVANTRHCFFLNKDGIVHAGGNNVYGQLGLSTIGPETNSFTSTPLNLPKIQQIFTSNRNSFFIDEDGNVFGCGDNKQGQLGVGNQVICPTPTLISIKDVCQIVSAESHTLFLKKNGNVWGCGNNDLEALGLEENKLYLTPTKLPITGISQIAIAPKQSIFLKVEGNVWACGASLGKLGIQRKGMLPVDCRSRAIMQITSLTDVNQIIAQFGTYLFVLKNKKVMVYGNSKSVGLGENLDEKTKSKSIISVPFFNWKEVSDRLFCPEVDEKEINRPKWT
jgi:alpha-tubulin suppressor-like RCC1 family protein